MLSPAFGDKIVASGGIASLHFDSGEWEKPNNNKIDAIGFATLFQKITIFITTITIIVMTDLDHENFELRGYLLAGSTQTHQGKLHSYFFFITNFAFISLL